MINKLIRQIFYTWIFIISITTLINIPIISSSLLKASEVISTDTIEEAYIEVQNREADRYLNPVLQLHLTIQDDNNITMLSSATAFSIFGSKAEGRSYLLSNDHFCSASILEEGDDSLSVPIITYTKGNQHASVYFTPAGVASVVYTDPTEDLCLLEINEYIKPVKFADYKVIEPIIPIKIVGAPDGVFPVIIDTYISSTMPRDEFPSDVMGPGRDFLFISGMVIPGSSGSPIFNKRGRVIGIVFASPQSLYGGIAIQSKDIEDWLERHDLSL